MSNGFHLLLPVPEANHFVGPGIHIEVPGFAPTTCSSWKYLPAESPRFLPQTLLWVTALKTPSLSAVSEWLPPHVLFPPSQLYYSPAHASPPNLYLEHRTAGRFASLIPRTFIAMKWILYDYLTNVNSTWQIPLESFLSSPFPLFCLGSGHLQGLSGFTTSSDSK